MAKVFSKRSDQRLMAPSFLEKYEQDLTSIRQKYSQLRNQVLQEYGNPKNNISKEQLFNRINQLKHNEYSEKKKCKEEFQKFRDELLLENDSHNQSRQEYYLSQGKNKNEAESMAKKDKFNFARKILEQEEAIDKRASRADYNHELNRRGNMLSSGLVSKEEFERRTEQSKRLHEEAMEKLPSKLKRLELEREYNASSSQTSEKIEEDKSAHLQNAEIKENQKEKNEQNEILTASSTDINAPLPTSNTQSTEVTSSPETSAISLTIDLPKEQEQQDKIANAIRQNLENHRMKKAGVSPEEIEEQHKALAAVESLLKEIDQDVGNDWDEDVSPEIEEKYNDTQNEEQEMEQQSTENLNLAEDIQAPTTMDDLRKEIDTDDYSETEDNNNDTENSQKDEEIIGLQEKNQAQQQNNVSNTNDSTNPYITGNIRPMNPMSNNIDNPYRKDSASIRQQNARNSKETYEKNKNEVNPMSNQQQESLTKIENKASLENEKFKGESDNKINNQSKAQKNFSESSNKTISNSNPINYYSKDTFTNNMNANNNSDVQNNLLNSNPNQNLSGSSNQKNEAPVSDKKANGKAEDLPALLKVLLGTIMLLVITKIKENLLNVNLLLNQIKNLQDFFENLSRSFDNKNFSREQSSPTNSPSTAPTPSSTVITTPPTTEKEKDLSSFEHMSKVPPPPPLVNATPPGAPSSTMATPSNTGNSAPSRLTPPPSLNTPDPSTWAAPASSTNSLPSLNPSTWEGSTTPNASSSNNNPLTALGNNGNLSNSGQINSTALQSFSTLSGEINRNVSGDNSNTQILDPNNKQFK